MAKSEGGGSGRGARRRKHWRGGEGAAPSAGTAYGCVPAGPRQGKKMKHICRDTSVGTGASSEYGCLGILSCGKDTMNMKLRAQTLKDSAGAN